MSDVTHLQMSRRNYRNNLAFVEAGFRSCWSGAQELVQGAKVLLDSSHHALAMSVSILALEELGKLFCLDGLLFARTDDHKAEMFAKSLKCHSTKLFALQLFPILLANIASFDPRFRETRFRHSVATGIADLRERGTAVRSLLDDVTFQKLDEWKQAGFYARPKGNTFVRPSEAVTREVAEAVYMLAWRASSTLDFVLNSGNLERYMDSARSLRSKLSEADHAAISERGRRLCSDLFSSDAEASASDPVQLRGDD